MANSDVIEVVPADEKLVAIHEQVCAALPGHTVLLMVFGPHGTPEPYKFTMLLNDDEMQEMLLQMLILHHERTHGVAGNDQKH